MVSPMTDSWATGPRHPPLSEETIGAALRRAADSWPDALALCVPWQGVRWSWRDLDQRVNQLASGFLQLGLRPGDRIGIWAPNRSEWVLTQFATARVGLILVSINPAYQSEELSFVLNKVDCRALIFCARFRSSDYLAILRELRERRLDTVAHFILLGLETEPDFLPFAHLIGAVDTLASEAALAGLDRHDPINIQFTSGTTGSPKGVTLTHRNILNNGAMVGARIGLLPTDRLCIPVPLYHCFGMVMGNLACVVRGAAMVYPSEAFDPGAVLRTVAAEGCTALYGVPTMFTAMLNHPTFVEHDLSTLRTGIMAGAVCPASTMQAVIERMNMRDITIAYGMTETSPVSLHTDPADPVATRVTTVGRVQSHLEVRLIDDHGAVVARGNPGEICVRGYSVMRGYWGDDEATAAAVDGEGWMHSGDVGTMDEEGYVRVTGRIKDLVIRGGENISPCEIENLLLDHPAVLDAQVVGLPDDLMGEELCACIIVRPGSTLDTASFRAFCKGRIAQYKVPRYLMVTDRFPMTITGKVQKFLLREQAALRAVDCL